MIWLYWQTPSIDFWNDFSLLQNHTHDLGGTASTSSFVQAVVSNLNTDLLQPQQQQQQKM